MFYSLSKALNIDTYILSSNKMRSLPFSIPFFFVVIWYFWGFRAHYENNTSSNTSQRFGTATWPKLEGTACEVI